MRILEIEFAGEFVVFLVEGSTRDEYPDCHMQALSGEGKKKVLP
jgi:hypothetical protein